MFSETSSANFGSVKGLFQGHKQYVPALAVIEGNYPGRIFSDDVRSPTMALVWAIGRWAYFERDMSGEGFGEPLTALIRHTIIPDSLKMTRHWFELYAADEPVVIRGLDECLKAFICRRHMETTFVWDEAKYRAFRSSYSVPKELTLEIVDIPILEDCTNVRPFVPENLRDRTTVGCTVKQGGKAVAQCRNNGFVMGQEFMGDIVTFDKDERGRGLGTAAVGWLDYCLAHELAPLWETTEYNTPSRRLAKKLGFVEDETYPVWAIEF